MKVSVGSIGKLLVLLGLQFVIASQAQAQATRTWVSGVGDDANPCSRTAPCKTFAGAISKTAAGGEISVLDPGGFGAVTITKSITLNGDGTLAGVLAAATNGIIVNALATDVVIIRSLSLVGVSSALNGITFLGGGELHVEDTKINGFGGNAINFTPNAGTGQLYVNNVSMRHNGGGILVAPTGALNAVATINGSTMDANGRGLRAQDGAVVTVRNSEATGNDAHGFIAYGASRAVDVTLENCVASGNVSSGVYSGPFSTVRISNVTTTKNNFGLTVNTGTIVSFGNNRNSGNTSGDGAPTSTPGQQ
jgi:parallel beta helix pectate lyase-like protein